MGSFSCAGPQGSRGGRDRRRREGRRGTAWRQLGEPPFFLATVLAQTQSPRGGHAAPHRHPGRSCGSHLGAARAGGRGGRRPRRFCGQKVVRQPGEAAELDAAGTTGRAPFPAASPASFPPAGSPVTERTGDSTQLGTWSPSWSWGPSRTFLEAQHRVFGAASPLSPSHPLTAPRPLPPPRPLGGVPAPPAGAF